MEQQFLDAILEDTYTVGSLKKRFLGLKLMLQKKIYQGEESKVAKESEESEVSKVTMVGDEEPETGVIKHESSGQEMADETKKWVESFNPEVLDKITAQNFDEVVKYVEDFISRGTNLSIFFVFIPDQDQLAGFGKWVRENLKNPQALFDVKIDPSLIGGCAITYKGVYKDYSLRSRIRANQHRIMEEFRKYLRN